MSPSGPDDSPIPGGLVKGSYRWLLYREGPTSGASARPPYVLGMTDQPLCLKNGAGRPEPGPRPSSMLNALLDGIARSALGAVSGIS